jgi:hypothetical protein
VVPGDCHRALNTSEQSSTFMHNGRGFAVDRGWGLDSLPTEKLSDQLVTKTYSESWCGLMESLEYLFGVSCLIGAPGPWR